MQLVVRCTHGTVDLQMYLVPQLPWLRAVRCLLPTTIASVATAIAAAAASATKAPVSPTGANSSKVQRDIIIATTAACARP